MKTLFFFTMTLAISACLFQGCKTTSTVSVAQLSGKWILQSFDGKAAAESFKGSIPTIEFDLTAGRVSGLGGCNYYSGTFNLKDSEFSAPDLVATEKMCLQENQESAFLRLLNNVSALSSDGRNLVFTQNGKKVLVFEKSLPLTTTNLLGVWRLTEIERASANTLFAGDILPTLEFDNARSMLTGNAGCNRYNAPYTLTGNTLSVELPVATRRGCTNMDGEIKFLHLLSGIATIELEGNSLIFKKDGVIQLKFEQ
jgi:heat shock protein HslJ